MTDSVKWGPGKVDRFRAWIDDELTRALSARQALERQWREWLLQYRPAAQQPLKSIPFEGAPLSRDTEILTRGGWKRIDVVRVGEDVLTRRDTKGVLDDGTLEWHPVEALPQRYADKLYHFKSRSIDLMVTEEHVMVAEKFGHFGTTQRIPARELWGKSNFFLPTHGSWLGGKHLKSLWGRDPNAIAEFVGWYLAEGSTFNAPGGPSAVAIAQREGANDENRQRLETIFTRCGFTWSANDRGFIVHKSSIPTGLFDLLVSAGRAVDKRVPSICWEWSADVLNSLLTGMVLGDGNIFDQYPMATFPKVNYYTISPGLADDVQVLCVLVGLHARVRSRVRVGAGGVIDGRKIQGKARCYEVTICGSERAKYDRSYREIVPYNDVAFCVTVKNHAIYARRNGIACWTGNSNSILPLTAIDVDTLYASFMQTLHASDDLWSVSALNERWEPCAKPIQDFLTFLDKSVLKMYDVNKRVVMEMVKLGTGIYKHGWTFEQRRYAIYDAKGGWQRPLRTVSKPFVDHVPLADFIIPPYATAVQPDAVGGAPWVAHRLRINVNRLRWLVNASVPMDPPVPADVVEKIIKWAELTPLDHQIAIQNLDYTKRVGGPGNFDRSTGTGFDGIAGGGTMPVNDVEIFEIHCRFATQGDSEDDLIIWYHYPTHTVVRGIANPYLHGARPFEVMRYFPGDGFYGIGVCEQKELFQKMISDLFNFQSDNVLLVNSRMLAAKAGANIAPGEPIFPGKVFITEGDVRSDIVSFQMAEVYPSLPTLIQYVQAVGERRTSVSDLNAGRIDALPSRTPASTMQALLQEGRRRPDLTVRDMRFSGLGPLGLRLIQLVQQYATTQDELDGQRWLRIAVETLGLPEGQLVAEKLGTPAENAELGLGVSINAVSGTANKDMEKQNLQNLLALNGQLAPQYIQMLQVAMQAQGSPLGEVALELAKGQSIIQRRLLEQYDFRDPDAIVPSIPEAPVLPGDPGALGAPPGPGANPGAPPNLGGMEALLAGAGAGMGNGDGGMAPGFGP